MSEAEEVEPVSSTATPEEAVAPLPEQVRARVVALAADALGRVPADQLPASLKRVATFAPNRRARLAGTQIASVLETDESFRSRVATQLRTAFPEVASALDSGSRPAAADPEVVAAVAYIMRPDGWRDVVAEATAAVTAEREVGTGQQSQQAAERLRRQLDSTLEELKDARRRHREELGRVKAENADLRHKLGDARARAKSAEAAAEQAGGEASQVERTMATAVAQQEAETRRLRARVEELERELASARRAERADRDLGTLRARLLLDTLLDTAQGLRRELALPAADLSPADLVEAHVAEQGARTPSGHGSLATDDPALLEALLALPRVHMVVDGYNVTKSTWPELSLEKQRDRILGGLAPLVARVGAEVTVVFDAADTKERPLVNRPRGVRVLYSPPGVIADDVIRDLVAAEPQGRPVVVVSSDQAVVRDVQRAGARTASAPALARLLAR